MKTGETIVIRRVANGWIVSEQWHPNTENSGMTSVYQTVAQVQEALPVLLSLPVPPAGDSLERVEQELAAKNAKHPEGWTPNPEKLPMNIPRCHRCRGSTFVVRHPKLTGHWLCENCKLDFVE